MQQEVVAVRCFAEQTGTGWEAHCVDLGITVQGDTLDSVKSELDNRIHEHIDSSLAARPSRAAATAARRAPLALRLRYWGLFLAGRLGLRSDALRDPRAVSARRSVEPRRARFGPDPRMASRAAR